MGPCKPTPAPRSEHDNLIILNVVRSITLLGYMRSNMSPPSVSGYVSDTSSSDSSFDTTVAPMIIKKTRFVSINQVPTWAQGSLTCLITQEIFQDPVATTDNHIYQRSAMLHWFSKHTQNWQVDKS